MKLSVLIMLAPAVLLLATCQKKPAPPTASQAEALRPEERAASDTIILTRVQWQAVGGQLGPLLARNLSASVSTNGQLQLPPQYLAQVSVVMGGLIESIPVREGDHVVKGGLLASMEHPDFIRLQESYLTTRQNLALLESEYQRQEKLYQGNVGAEKVFEQSQTAYQSEKARLASLESQLRLIGLPIKKIAAGSIMDHVPVRSPIAGYVSRINVNTGTLAQPGTVLFEIVDTDHLRAELRVYEKDLFQVRVGQPVHLQVANQDRPPLEGRIREVGKTFLESTQSAIVYVEIESGRQGLLPGMYVDAWIEVGQQKTLAVPEQAVVRTEGKEWIFLLLQHRKQAGQEELVFKRVEVKTGVSQAGYLAVTPLEELPAAPVVVQKGAFFVLAKSKEGEGDPD